MRRLATLALLAALCGGATAQIQGTQIAPNSLPANRIQNPAAWRSALGLLLGVNVVGPDGTGAAGTWGISINGTATNSVWAKRLEDLGLTLANDDAGGWESSGPISAPSFLGSLIGNAATATNAQGLRVGASTFSLIAPGQWGTTDALATGPITTDDDITTSAVVSAGQFTGSGAGLTGIPGTAIGSGQIPPARLGTGTPSASVFLRGDGQWATAPGEGGTSLPAVANGNLATGTGTSVGDSGVSLANIPRVDGTGATGTWPVSVTGSAAGLSSAGGGIYWVPNADPSLAYFLTDAPARFSDEATFEQGVTAEGFIGPLTGNVTGNLTGNVTGNASTASTAGGLLNGAARIEAAGSQWNVTGPLAMNTAGLDMAGHNITDAGNIGAGTVSAEGGFFGPLIGNAATATTAGHAATATEAGSLKNGANTLSLLSPGLFGTEGDFQADQITATGGFAGNLTGNLTGTADRANALPVSLTGIPWLAAGVPSVATPANATSAPFAAVYNVKAYGAKGDGTTDDTAAIQAAIDAVPADGGTVYFPAATYAIASTVYFNKAITYQMAGAKLLYTGSGSAALVVGSETSGVKLQDGKIYGGPWIDRAAADWDTATAAIRLSNAWNWYIEGVRLSKFQNGIDFVGDGHGCVYNEIHVGCMYDLKTYIKTTQANGGWANDNTLMGGTWSQTAAGPASGAGSRMFDISLTPGQTHSPTNWRFIGCAFESGATGASWGTIANGTDFTFLGCRFETISHDDQTITIAAPVSGVLILGGQQTDLALSDSSTTTVRYFRGSASIPPMAATDTLGTAANRWGSVWANTVQAGRYAADKSFQVAFTGAGSAYQYVDFYLPASTGYQGAIEATVTGRWLAQNHIGRYRKSFGFGGGSTGTTLASESTVWEVGATGAKVKLDAPAWDAGNSRWYMRLWHLANTTDTVAVRFSAISAHTTDNDAFAQLAQGAVTAYVEAAPAADTRTYIGPAIVSGNLVTGTGTAIQDSGVALSNIPRLNADNTFTHTTAGAATYPVTLSNADSTLGTTVGLRFSPSANPARYAAIQGIQKDGSNAIDLAFLTGVGASITEKVRISYAGNVGIGPTYPSALLHLSGTAPAEATGNGTAATNAFTVAGAAGGATSGTTGQTAGAGSSLTLTAGAGGAAPSGSTNGNGGSITLTPGAAGAGAGTAGTAGSIILNGNVRLVSGAGAGKVPVSDASGNLTLTAQTATLQAILDGGGAALLTGRQIALEVPYDCAINSITVVTDVAGTLAVQVYQQTYANYDVDPTNDSPSTLVASQSLAAGDIKGQTTNLSTALYKGRWLTFWLNGAAGAATKATISLGVTKS